MARITSLGIPPTPCQLNPDAWLDHNNAAAKKACRTLCAKRFECAKAAVSSAKTRSLEGVVAGIACPPDNDKGNSKTLTHAIDQLRSLAEFGAPRRSEPVSRPVVVAVTTPAVPLQLSFDDLLQAC